MYTKSVPVFIDGQTVMSIVEDKCQILVDRRISLEHPFLLRLYVDGWMIPGKWKEKPGITRPVR